MKRLIVTLLLGGAAIWTAAAVATPSQGQSSTILSIGSLQANLAFNTGLTPTPDASPGAARSTPATSCPSF